MTFKSNSSFLVISKLKGRKTKTYTSTKDHKILESNEKPDSDWDIKILFCFLSNKVLSHFSSILGGVLKVKLYFLKHISTHPNGDVTISVTSQKGNQTLSRYDKNSMSTWTCGVKEPKTQPALGSNPEPPQLGA